MGCLSSYHRIYPQLYTKEYLMSDSQSKQLIKASITGVTLSTSDDENMCPDDLNNPALDGPQKTGPSIARTRLRAKRRLSSSLDADRPVRDLDIDCNRGLIHGIDASTLIVASPLFKGKKRWSVGTETENHKRESYCEKQTSIRGHSFTPSDSGIGYACKKGLKPVSPNQDSFLVIRVEGGVSVYGVFDGHGRVGHDVSNFVKDQIPRLLFDNISFTSGSDIGAALLDAFARTQQLLEAETRSGRLDAMSSGTTATVVVQASGCLWTAHVGDSRTILYARAAPENALALTVDHKPNLPAERARVEQNGGVVIKPPADVNHRVYVKNQKFPGLAMSRALGDLVGYYGAGISATPEIRCVKLADHPGMDTLAICSDGVWEFITDEECAKLLSETPKGEEMHAAEAICKESWDRWMKEENGYIVDDITAIVVNIDNSNV